MNKEAVKYLERQGVLNASYIVARLIDGGFMGHSPELTKPQEYAQKARAWLSPKATWDAAMVFDYASGWDTKGWETVLDEKTTIPMRKNIFKALQILAREAAGE